jgi:hypothetical protein
MSNTPYLNNHCGITKKNKATLPPQKYESMRIYKPNKRGDDAQAFIVLNDNVID